VTLADTSAWVEYMRATGSAAAQGMRRAITAGELLTTEPVMMEVLAGARDRAHERELRNFLAGADFIPVGSLAAWERAAVIHGSCRRAGLTLRSQLDCLIAAVAIREDVAVLHADRDFDLIARHTPLRVAAH